MKNIAMSLGDGRRSLAMRARWVARHQPLRKSDLYAAGVMMVIGIVVSLV